MRKFWLCVVLLMGLFLLHNGLARADIDPATAQKLLASDGAGAAGDTFGFSVSVHGNTAVIGAPYDDGKGSAYVFTRSGSVWTQQQKLNAADGTAGDMFGNSVSVSGDTVVIGAYLDDHQDTYAGSAYVFTRSGSVWSQQNKLEVTDRRSLFGSSVAVDGDTLVIGARHDSQTGLYAGAAHIFTRFNGVWTRRQKLTANKTDDGYTGGSNFGYSVSIDGDTVVIGALNDDKKDEGWVDSGPGSAYVFTRSGSCPCCAAWTRQQKFMINIEDGAAAGDQFGRSVSVDGDTLVIGTYRGSNDNNIRTGSAYIFTRPHADKGLNAWRLQKKLAPADGKSNDVFGSSVAVDGDTVVIGAYGDDENGNASGSAYVFTRTASGWSQEKKLMTPDDADGAAGDYFGMVSLDGDTVVIGAPALLSASKIGSAYVYRLPPQQ